MLIIHLTADTSLLHRLCAACYYSMSSELRSLCLCLCYGLLACRTCSALAVIILCIQYSLVYWWLRRISCAILFTRLQTRLFTMQNSSLKGVRHAVFCDEWAIPGWMHRQCSGLSHPFQHISNPVYSRALREDEITEMTWQQPDQHSSFKSCLFNKWSQQLKVNCNQNVYNNHRCEIEAKFGLSKPAISQVRAHNLAMPKPKSMHNVTAGKIAISPRNRLDFLQNSTHKPPKMYGS